MGGGGLALNLAVLALAAFWTVGVAGVPAWARGVVVAFAALDDHPVTTRDAALLTVSAAVGGVLAVARAYTVRVWRTDGGVVRQGGVPTAVLWVVSIGLHLLVDARADDRSLTNASLLAYLGFVLLVQNLVLVARARREGLLVSAPVGPRTPRR